MELYERRRRILAAVVDDYVETAEPVGSEMLARKHNFGVKPATIRNELAAMSELGYLRQPHTSAGRVPSDLGYRYYVNELMPPPRLTPSETRYARQFPDPYAGEIEEVLQRTARILASLTQYTSLVTPPQPEVTSISQVALLSVKPGKFLLITVLSTGHIDHRTVDCHGKLSGTDVVSLGNLLNARFHQADTNNLSGRISEELPPELRHLDGLYARITPLLRQALVAASDDEVFVEGTSHILKQPEFAEGAHAGSIFEALEQQRTLYQILSSALLGSDVTVIIGAENRFREMSECSFVASSYSIGGRACGSIGVIGPTRMDYRRAVAAVRLMALNLSDLLTALSIG